MNDNRDRTVCDVLDPDTAVDLLAGTLPAARREELLRHLRGCPVCEARLRELAAHHERRRAEGPPATVAAPRRPGRWFGVVAAAAALALLLFGHAGDDDRKFAPVALPTCTETLLVRNHDGDAARVRLVDGLAAYARGEYGLAVELLDGVASEGTDAVVRDIYLGSACALTGRDARALGLLDDEDIDAVPDPWGNELRWTLCGVLQRLGHDTRADSMLQVLAAEPGEVGDRARRHLDEDPAR